LNELGALVGLEVIINPEWQQLLAELDSYYPDKGNFVTTVATVVQAWVRSMTQLLDDSEREDWTEALLERLKAAGSRLRISLEVAPSDRSRCSTSWADRSQGFVIHLPKKLITAPAELTPIFYGELSTCFDSQDAKSKPPPTIAVPTASGSDDWADVEMDKTTGKVAIVEKLAQSPARIIPQYLPSAATLPRPDELFLRPPYHLIVAGGDREIEIQSSHSPSLQLLADYFQRWCRANHQDTRSVRPAVSTLVRSISKSY
jgi:hypothetical protein